MDFCHTQYDSQTSLLFCLSLNLIGHWWTIVIVSNVMLKYPGWCIIYHNPLWQARLITHHSFIHRIQIDSNYSLLIAHHHPIDTTTTASHCLLFYLVVFVSYKKPIKPNKIQSIRSAELFQSQIAIQLDELRDLISFKHPKNC